MSIGDNSSSPSVSIVVITLNEASRIASCLRSIAAVSYPPDRLEVILVDSGSRDDTVSIASQFPVKIVTLSTTEPSPGMGRNEGARLARSELIEFVDGDTEIDSEWLGSAVVLFQDPRVGAVVGRRIQKKPTSVFDRIVSYEWELTPAGRTVAPAAGGLFRRTAFEAVGGYDPRLPAKEEPELGFRLCRKGYSILRLDAPRVYYSGGIPGIRDYLRREVRDGLGSMHVFMSYLHSRQKPPGFMKYVVVSDAVVFLAAGLVALGLWIKPSLLLVALVGLGLLLARKATQLYAISRNPVMSIAYAIHTYFLKLPTLAGHVLYVLGGGWRRAQSTSPWPQAGWTHE